MTKRLVDQTCPICGRVRKVRLGNTERAGFTGACRPCNNRSRHKQTLVKHHPLYATWSSMKQRCSDPEFTFFHRYGGRGITVAPEWLGRLGFKRFVAWAEANGWTPGLTIDRIDNDGNYEPGNCQWLTRADNSKKGNTRKEPNHDHD